MADSKANIALRCKEGWQRVCLEAWLLGYCEAGQFRGGEKQRFSGLFPQDTL